MDYKDLGVTSAVDSWAYAGESISVYPNPVKADLNIELNAATESQAVFELRDMAGREVMLMRGYCTKGLNTYTLDVSQISSGIYTLIIRYEGEEQQVKVMIEPGSRLPVFG